MGENWKIIEGFEDYKISNLGKIKSLKSNKEKELQLIIDNRGYYVINLCKEGKMYQRLIHRLVAQHFINNPNNYNVINHKDLNKLNNNKDNLEWCNTRHNVLHYYKNNETSSSYAGVSKSGKTFRTQLYTNKERYDFGTFKTEQEAAEVYKKALNILETDGLEKMIEYQKQVKNKFSSKYKGVSYDKSRKKWKATIKLKGISYLNKRYSTENEAIEAVINKYTELGIELHYTHKEYIKQEIIRLNVKLPIQGKIIK